MKACISVIFQPTHHNLPVVVLFLVHVALVGLADQVEGEGGALALLAAPVEVARAVVQLVLVAHVVYARLPSEKEGRAQIQNSCLFPAPLE